MSKCTEESFKCNDIEGSEVQFAEMQIKKMKDRFKLHQKADY